MKNEGLPDVLYRDEFRTKDLQYDELFSIFLCNIHVLYIETFTFLLVGRCRKPFSLRFLKNGIYKVDNEKLEYLSTITVICNESYSISASSPDAMTCVQNARGSMVWQPPYVPRCYREYISKFSGRIVKSVLSIWVEG